MSVKSPKTLFINIKHTWTDRRSFLLLVLALLYINHPIWSSTFWPKHDSYRLFQTFYLFYNNLFLDHELTRWLPYGTYGIQPDLFQLYGISPFAYFMGAVGFLFRIENALTLFKLAMLLELFTLLLGVYLLSREIFKYKYTSFFVSLGVIASTVWIDKIFWNLRFGYFLPLIFYLLLRFHRDERPHFLWLAGFTSIMAVTGSVMYHSAVYGVVILIFLAGLTVKYRPWKCIFERSRRNAAFFSLLLFTAVVYVYFIAHMLAHAHTQQIARDPETKLIALETFLTYEGETDLGKYFALFYGTGTDTYTLYIGMLPLVFCIFALLRSDSYLFATMGSIALFLFLFSLADTSFIARLSYRLFPLMHYYRYIGHIGSVLRLFLFLCAGFGLDSFLGSLRQEGAQKNARRTFLFSGLGFLAFVVFVIGKINADGKLYPIPYPMLFPYAWTVLGISVLILGSRFARSTAVSGFAAILFLALDLFAYQHTVFDHFPKVDVPSEVAQVRRLPFQDVRQFYPAGDTRLMAAYDTISKSSDRETALMYSFMHFDPCLPEDWTGFWSKGPYTLSKLLLNDPPHAQGRALKNVPRLAAKNRDLQMFLRMVGCETPKLRFYTNVAFAESLEEAEGLIRQTNADEKPVLRFVPEHIKSEWVSRASGLETNEPGTVRVTRFSNNTLELEANVIHEGGAWLYYADAYHPDWRAYIDGKKTFVAEANLAFKAVKLEPGKHTVRFSFFSGLSSAASLILILLSVIFVACLLGASVKLLESRHSTR